MKSLITLAIVFLTFLSYGQMGFRTEIGTGASFMFEDIKSTGFNFSVEPKVLFGKRMAAGVRIESNVLYAGTFDMNQVGEVSVGTTFRNALLVKLDYSLPVGNGYTRVMFGAMAGFYTQRGIGDKATNEITIVSNRGPGFAPEIGFARGSFKASLMYHIIPGKDTVISSVGLWNSSVESQEVSRNYLALNLSLNLFSIGEDEH